MFLDRMIGKFPNRFIPLDSSMGKFPDYLEMKQMNTP